MQREMVMERMACGTCGGTITDSTAAACPHCHAALSTDAQPTPPAGTPPVRRRRASGPLLVAIIGVAILIVAAAATLVAISRDGDESTSATTTDTTADTTTEPTASSVTDNAGTSELAEIEPSTIVAEASSVLSGTAQLSYGPANLLDRDNTTAWNHDHTDPGVETGVGVELTFTFRDEVDVRRIDIVNGYTKSDEVFTRNARVSDVEVVTEGGRTTALSLRDDQRIQRFDDDFGTTRFVTLRVTGIYAGQPFDGKPAYNDLALSEVAFYTTRPA